MVTHGHHRHHASSPHHLPVALTAPLLPRGRPVPTRLMGVTLQCGPARLVASRPPRAARLGLVRTETWRGLGYGCEWAWPAAPCGPVRPLACPGRYPPWQGPGRAPPCFRMCRPARTWLGGMCTLAGPECRPGGPGPARRPLLASSHLKVKAIQGPGCRQAGPGCCLRLACHGDALGLGGA